MKKLSDLVRLVKENKQSLNEAVISSLICREKGYFEEICHQSLEENIVTFNY